jgi:hypothetical protein
MDAVPLFLTTLGLTAGIAYILTRNNLQQIKSQWNQRRCELPVMIMANLFKPEDDPRTGGEFAQDNFEFCSRFFAKSVLQALLTPVFMIIGKQLDVTKVLEEALNLMRYAMAEAMNSFSKIIDPFYRRFMMIGYRFGFIFKKFMNSMERIYGIAVAAIYMGISLLRGVLNFKDFVIKVILIIMAILIAAIFFLFFILFPVMPVILTTIAVLASVGIGVAGAGAFCFAPETQVVLIDGTSIPICKVQVGQKLKDGGYIEGILLTEREAEVPLYDYKGIIVSGSHVVHEDTVWKSVESSNQAVPIVSTIGRLYSLRTSTRMMTCRSPVGEETLFRDWEEIPEGDTTTDAEWDVLVQKMLANDTITQEPSEQDPLLSMDLCVELESGFKTPLSSVRIGDKILSGLGGYTRVLGIYRGMGYTSKETDWFTDGVWWLQGTSSWVHSSNGELQKGIQSIGLHLITESGTFEVYGTSTSGCVRDFTEVGYKNLAKAMDFLLDRLNEKSKE